MGDPSGRSTVLRRFVGPAANELAALCRPDGGTADVVRQAEAVYGELTTLLAAEKASFRDLACETLFLCDVRRDLLPVLDVRARLLADAGQSAGAGRPAFIEQAPVTPGVSVELSATAVVPRRRSAWSVRDVPATPPCACEGCERAGARLVRLGEQTSLHTTNVYGSGADAFAEVSDMFGQAERLLEACGMGFGDVVRTWVYLRDIDRDYDVLNRARREFFRVRGVECRPASTGVQGIPLPDAHDFSLRVHAMRLPAPRAVTPMSTPSLNEAWSYGADFSRGLRVVEANGVTLHVSGTASIDETGRSVHVGDFEGQVERMLHNIASLLAEQGAAFEHVVSGVVYLRNRDDAPVLRELCRARGFDGFACALVETPLCRRELLCEAEAVALLPLGSVEA